MSDENTQATPAEPIVSEPDESKADTTPEESAPAEAPTVNVEQADNVEVSAPAPSGDEDTNPANPDHASGPEDSNV